MRKHRFATLLLTIGLLLTMASVASAHAVVFPQKATANAYEKFSLRVPTEKDQPTVKVKVAIPEGFTISRVQPLPGWQYEFTKDAAGHVTAITWSGGEIGPTEFQEFVFQGKTPKDPGKFAWKIAQTYKDGTVVDWAGPADAKEPASIVEVTAAAGQTDAHGATTPAAPAQQIPAPQPAPAPQQSAGGGFTPIAAYGGLFLGLVAVVLALRRR